MSKYLRKFETEAAYTAAESTLALPNVSLITATDRVAYKAGSPTPPAHDYSLDYFTLVAIDNCEFEFTSDSEMSVSTDNGENWESLEYGAAITVSSGDKLLVKSTEGVWGKFFTSSGRYNIEGNIASLGYGDDFIGETTIGESSFAQLFIGDNNLISAENLVLPATTLASECYSSMFANCTSLTTAPSVLPATTLESGCYQYMFQNCTSLTTAPQLPATTLASDCYRGMFNSCTSLSSITCLATDISATDCTYEWVDGVAASGTFTKAASMTDWGTGISGIPSGWNVVNA